MRIPLILDQDQIPFLRNLLPGAVDTRGLGPFKELAQEFMKVLLPHSTKTQKKSTEGRGTQHPSEKPTWTQVHYFIIGVLIGGLQRLESDHPSMLVIEIGDLFIT